MRPQYTLKYAKCNAVLWFPLTIYVERLHRTELIQKYI